MGRAVAAQHRTSTGRNQEKDVGGRSDRSVLPSRPGPGPARPVPPGPGPRARP